MIREAAVPGGIGIVAGVVPTWLGTPRLEGLLYEVSLTTRWSRAP